MKSVSRLLALAGLLAGVPALAGVNSWTQTGPEGGPIHALATHPTDPNIAVISTNRGLARSTNCSTDCTWTIVKNDTVNAPFEIVFDPSSPNRVIASDGRLYLSENTGQTFQLAQGPAAQGNVGRIAFGPDGTLYATTLAGNVYRSASPLATWIPLTNTAWPANSRIDSIAVDPDNSRIVYVGIELLGVYRSIDGGLNWAGPLTTGFASSTYLTVTQLAVDPADSTHVFAATNVGIQRSVNSGSSWTSADGFPVFSIDFKPGASDQMIAVGSTGLVLRSSNNGASWTSFGIDLQSNGQPVARYAAGAVTRLLYASATGMSVSGDLQNSLSNRNVGLGGGASVSRIVKANDGTVYVGMDVDWGSVYRRGNPDYQYAGQYSALLDAITGVRQTTGLAVSATNSNIIYFVNRGYELIRTIDGAQTWSAPHPQFTSGSGIDFITDVQISPNNPNIAYVARVDTGVWKTINGGLTFTQLTNSPAYVAALGINPLNSDVLYAAGGPMNGSGIYKSIDGGATWTVQLAPSALSHLIYNDFAFHPADVNTVYAMGWGGVQKTVNGGGAWSLVNFGPASGTSIPASALLFDPVIPSTMIVLSNGNTPGFSRSVDGGVTWRETAVDIPGRTSILYRGVLQDGNLIAGTNSLGLIEYLIAPDLSVSMPDMPPALPLGTNYQNPVTVTNRGTHASSASELSIVRPTWLTPANLPNCASNGLTLTCQVGVLQPGESVVVPLSFAVGGLVNGTTFSVRLAPHEADSNSANNAIDEAVTAEERIDLDMTLNAVPAAFDLDGTTVVTAQVVNNGPSPATNARIEFALPALTLESATPSVNSCDSGGTVTCNFGTIPAGGSASVVLRFRGNAVGTFPLSAMVYASGPDSDNAFNTAQLNMVVRPVSDIAVSLADSVDPATSGVPFTYTATVSNSGPGAGAVQLVVPVTGAAVSTAAATGGGTCTTTTTSVQCSFAQLASGATATVAITVNAAAAGTALATATATFSGTDPVSANNTASATTTVNAASPPPGSGSSGGGGRVDWLALLLLGALALSRGLIRTGKTR